MRKPKRKRSVRGIFKRGIIALAVLVCAVLLIQVYVTKNWSWNEVYRFVGLEVNDEQLLSGEVSIAFLDVGQGDCAVLRAGKSVVLIDAGDWTAEDKILRFLDRNGIDTIDYAVASHPHADHIGGLRAVLRHCNVKQVLFTNHSTELTPNNSTYIDLLNYLIDHEIPTRTVADDEVIALDRGALTVLLAGNFSDLNNCSIIMRYDFEQTSFLFTGDAEWEAEAYLLEQGADLHCNVLKAGHHGSSTSSYEALLEAAHPEYIIASCGVDNAYGHPHREFLDRVAQTGATLVRTDTMGTAVFTTDGKTVRYLGKQRKAA